MNLRSKFFESLATKWIKKQDQAKALKQIGERYDWKALAKKCHDKISVEYRFWITKKDSPQRNAKLLDMTKDVGFMNSIEGKEVINQAQLTKLKELCIKYATN